MNLFFKQGTKVSIVILINISVLMSQAGFLHNVDGEVVDGNGDPILLRGFGLGGWLVPEGYMLINTGWINGYESPTDIENHVLDLIGPDAADDFWELYRSNYVAQEDIDQIAEWGFNHIRVPFHYKQFHDSSGTQNPIGYGIIDELITWCQPHNMYIILDMHCAPGGQNGGPISDSDGTARLWLEEENKELTIQIWREIAEYYSDETLIAGYDLINEPVLPGGVTLEEFKQLYMDITEAIREVDNNHLLWIEGNWYGTDFAGLTPPWDDNMGYSFHKYWGSTALSTIQQYLNLRDQHNVPLWMGESGENSNEWYYQVFKLFEENNIGWNFWTHKKVDKLTSPYSAYVSPQYQLILDYVSGNIDQLDANLASMGWTSLANSLKIENCDIRPGLIAALTDPEYGTISKPFAPHSIPGMIPAYQYDIGARGLAYTDSDYWNDGDGGYNDGWVGRNDGVDLEGSDDHPDIPFTVGWTEAGEWLGYTIQDVTPGTYEVSFSISAPEAGGIFFAQLEGQNLGVINVPATGGWYNWDDISGQTVTISEGEKFLKIQIVQNGFNIQSITFDAVLSTDQKELNPQTFNLGEPYPNPFNPAVNFQLNLSEKMELTSFIYGIKGNLVKTIDYGSLDIGTHYLKWNGSNEKGSRVESGVYFFKIQGDGFNETRKLLLLK